jgi:hypothetical protein
MTTTAPILVDRGLLPAADQALSRRLLRRFAEMNQRDRPLVLLAERPDRWTPTRNRVDRALEGQGVLDAEILRGGGALDAVLYLDLGLFSRRRRRQAALEDLADRYGIGTEQLRALVASERMAIALQGAVGEVVSVSDEQQLSATLKEWLDD